MAVFKKLGPEFFSEMQQMLISGGMTLGPMIATELASGGNVGVWVRDQKDRISPELLRTDIFYGVKSRLGESQLYHLAPNVSSLRQQCISPSAPV